MIRREHPDLDRALMEGHAAVEVDGHPVNASLHLLMHEVVAAQLWTTSRPRSGKRRGACSPRGFEREQILHMLAASALDLIWVAAREERDYDRDAHLASLAALPGTWERPSAGD